MQLALFATQSPGMTGDDDRGRYGVVLRVARSIDEREELPPAVEIPSCHFASLWSELLPLVARNLFFQGPQMPWA